MLMLMLMSRLSSLARKVSYAYVYAYACVASRTGLNQSRRRSEDVCFDKGHFNASKATVADAAGYEFSSAR